MGFRKNGHGKFMYNSTCRRFVAAFVGLVVFTAAGCVGLPGTWASTLKDLPTEEIHPLPLSDGRLAMSAYMLNGNKETDEAWRKTLRQMKAMGVQVVEIGQIAWHEIEKRPGQYNWGYVEKVLRINKEENLGLEIIVDFMFVNPGLDGIPRLPGHLQGRNFDDPEVISALSRLYAEYFKLNGAQATRWLFQHFENASDVVAKRPQDIGRLQQLLKESFAQAKRIRPDIRTGVCIQKYGTYGKNQKWPASEIKRWNIDIGTDVIPIISFRPDEFVSVDISQTRAEFEAVLEAAGGRPIALHECGHHSSVKVGSSEERQAAFVRELFALLKSHHQHIELATWYEYSDLNLLRTWVIGLVIGRGNPKVQNYLTHFLSSCGLMTSDNRPKSAAVTWCKEAALYYQFRKKLLNETQP